MVENTGFPVDIPTLAMARGLIQIVLAGLILFLWYHDRSVKGPRFWAMGFLLNGIALFIFSLNIPVLAGIIIPINHLTIGISGWALVLGFWLYNQHKINWRILFIILCGVIFSSIFWGIISPNVKGRILLTAFIQLLSFLYIQYSLGKPIRQEVEPLSKALRIMVWIYILIYIWSYGNLAGILPKYAAIIDLDYHTAFFSISSLLFMLGLAVGVLGLQFLRLAASNADLAVTDYLTGLLNRRGLIAFSRHEDHRRLRDFSFSSVICIDIDHFKSINDSYGHSAGDIVLKRLSTLFKSFLRGNDIAARIGGEEFAIILNLSNEKDACEVTERIRIACSNEVIILKSGTELRFSISAGVAEYSPDEEIMDAISKADKALYAAKESGRNCVKCFASLKTPKLKDNSKI